METEVLQPTAIRFPSADEFTALLTERTVLDAHRRAKYMLLSLSGDLVLAIHLALWGTIALVPTEQPRLPETLIIWHLDQNKDLRFVDKLGYARAALGPADILTEKLDLNSLGPEALDPSFDIEVLARQIQKRRGVLKTVLLNQRILAGLGNRDADESMWLAEIDPRRSAASLTSEELMRLHSAIRQVLAEGIDLRGTQRDLFGRKGRQFIADIFLRRPGNPVPAAVLELLIYGSVEGIPFIGPIVNTDFIRLAWAFAKCRSAGRGSPTQPRIDRRSPYVYLSKLPWCILQANQSS